MVEVPEGEVGADGGGHGGCGGGIGVGGPPLPVGVVALEGGVAVGLVVVVGVAHAVEVGDGGVVGVGVVGDVVELGGVAVAAGHGAVAVADAHGQVDRSGAVSGVGGVGPYVDGVVDQHLGVDLGYQLVDPGDGDGADAGDLAGLTGCRVAPFQGDAVDEDDQVPVHFRVEAFGVGDLVARGEQATLDRLGRAWRSRRWWWSRDRRARSGTSSEGGEEGVGPVGVPAVTVTFLLGLGDPGLQVGVEDRLHPGERGRAELAADGDVAFGALPDAQAPAL